MLDRDPENYLGVNRSTIPTELPRRVCLNVVVVLLTVNKLAISLSALNCLLVSYLTIVLKLLGTHTLEPSKLCLKCRTTGNGTLCGLSGMFTYMMAFLVHIWAYVLPSAVRVVMILTVFANCILVVSLFGV